MSAERQEIEGYAGGSGVVVRPVLAAGLAFLDLAVEAARAAKIRGGDITAWLKAWLVNPGLMPMPPTVQEPGAGTVAVGTASSGAWATGTDARLCRIVAAASGRVTLTLGGMLASPVDDRFLSAAIHSGRVTRTSGERGPTWRASPSITDRLSDVVLSLFAADALSNRDEYDACLCVCDVCGKVALRPGQLARTRCEEHEESVG
jgi:hypothetical protein